jgi:hypothetical protein
MQFDAAGDGHSYAISRNLSASGLLMATAEKLEVGASVKVSFQLPAARPGPQSVQGQIVRVTSNSEDPEGIWPHMAAVEFDAEDPELEPLLAGLTHDRASWPEKG